MSHEAESAAATAVREIPRRDLEFLFEGVELKSWHQGGLHVSHFFNALSVFFPEGESFFIDAVKHFAGEVKSPELARQVEGFLGQEAMHSREHRRYNRALEASGLPARELEREVVRLLDFFRRNTSAEIQLAATTALEHFTAMLADQALTDDEAFRGGDPRMSALWRWHAIEETEHKAVAYDVYKEVCGEGAVAYTRRAGAMIVATVILWTLLFADHLRFVRREGALTDARGWAAYFRFLFLAPGVLPRLVRPWLDYFRPSFHPWEHDNSALVAKWKAAFAAAGAPPA